MTDAEWILGQLARVQFLTSAPRLSLCPPNIGQEVAFAGRSNAGKSSAINTLTRQKQLARASKTPGRTQLINFFALDESRRLVDLPGYGYAKVPEAMKLAWQKHLGDYLQRRESLRGLVVLMDIRHPLTSFDRNLLDWARSRQLAVHILLTKCDKLSRSRALDSLRAVEARLTAGQWVATVQLFSAVSRQGLDDAALKLASWLDLTPPSEPPAETPPPA